VKKKNVEILKENANFKEIYMFIKKTENVVGLKLENQQEEENVVFIIVNVLEEDVDILKKFANLLDLKFQKKKIISKCAMKKLAKGQTRRQCCLNQKICVGKKCHLKKGLCRFVGHVITKKTSRKCAWKVVSSHAKRLRCCNHRKYCHAKYGICKTVSRKCNWSSKVIKMIPKRTCYMKEYFKNNSKRRRCCSWVKYCIGNQCRPIQKSCKWVGFIYTKELKQNCNWKKKINEFYSKTML